jgi:Zn-dependent oligopeptidase
MTLNQTAYNEVLDELMRLKQLNAELLAAAVYTRDVLDVVMGNNIWEARQMLIAAIKKAEEQA